MASWRQLAGYQAETMTLHAFSGKGCYIVGIGVASQEKMWRSYSHGLLIDIATRLACCHGSCLLKLVVSQTECKYSETMWQLEAPLIPNYSCHKWLVFQDKSGLVLSPFILNSAGQSILSHKGRKILPWWAFWCMSRTENNSADLQMRHQKLCTLARHFSVGHFA